MLKELGGAKVVGSGGIVFCGVGGMFGVVDCGKMSFGCVESDFNMGEGGGFGGSGRRRVQRCWSVCADGLRVAKAITDADPHACVLLCAAELCSLTIWNTNGSNRFQCAVR